MCVRDTAGCSNVGGARSSIANKEEARSRNAEEKGGTITRRTIVDIF